MVDDWHLLVLVTMQDALPLADQPQLLQPNARREELFGMPRQPVTVPATGDSPPGLNNPLEGKMKCLCPFVYVYIINFNLCLVSSPQVTRGILVSFVCSK